MRGTHIVSFDMKRLDVRHRTQIIDTRQARNKPFVMDFYIIIVLLTLVLSSSDVVKGSLKSKSSASLKSKIKIKNPCITCRVTRKLENITSEPGEKVTLKCAFAGIHPSNITWLRNGKPLRKNKNFVVSEWQNHNGSKLKMKIKIKRGASKHNASYSCLGRNAKGQEIVTTGYVGIKQVYRDEEKKLTTTPSIVSKQRTGKCEMYKGKICAPYIQDNVLIFVEDAVEKQQVFIEMTLKFGYDAMSPNLTMSCRSAALPLWCYHHFPQCSIVNSKAEPKSICKSECNLIQSKDCKAEYNERKKAQSSEGDLFPDCKLLPDEDPLQTNCVSIKRHVPSLQPGPANPVPRGKCLVYDGDVCKTKHGKKVFVKDAVGIFNIQKVIKETLSKQNRYVSSRQCQGYLEPLLCHLHLPDCDESSASPKGKPICQDECLVLKNNLCKKEYSRGKKFSAAGISFDCSSVEALTSSSGKCSRILKNEHLEENTGPNPPSPIPKIGRCQPYRGTICKSFLGTKNIFVEVDNKESAIESKLKIANKQIKNFPRLSQTCKPFVLPLMCFHLFPFCESSSQPTPSYICRRDCFRIQHEFCRSEYPIAEQELLLGSILFPKCNALPVSNERCTSLQSLFITNVTVPTIYGDCYVGKGELYRGFTNTTASGEPCQRWDTTFSPNMREAHNFCRNPGGRESAPWCFAKQGGVQRKQTCNIPKCAPDDATLNGTGADYLGSLAVTISGRRCLPWNEIAPGLIWAHNYCRNPNGKRDKPWCYIDKNKWEYCNVPEVSAKKDPESDSDDGHLSNLLYTVIPCVVFGMVVAIVIIAICWKQHKQGPDAIKTNTTMTITVMLPELRTIPGENILLPKFIGNGKFGSLHSGEIISEDGSRVSRLVKVALKDYREEFINQAKRWSQFHHPNLLTIEAITSASEPMTLVYESAAHGSLYQYLIYHSPNNPNFTRDHALLDRVNLLDISRQIAAGMAYLSSHGYVHGELMTRNCQVAHSMVIKITDFSVDRDVCYFRRPNKRGIALGWMAPETIPTETYTVYSDVWAFGILLWEIFTYGFQPYFGFTLPEVREKVLGMVLLEQPRDCIPVVYELMRSCWIKTPTHRPQFVDLHEDLNTLCNEYIEEEEPEPRYVRAVNI